MHVDCCQISALSFLFFDAVKTSRLNNYIGLHPIGKVHGCYVLWEGKDNAQQLLRF